MFRVKMWDGDRFYFTFRQLGKIYGKRFNRIVSPLSLTPMLCSYRLHERSSSSSSSSSWSKTSSDSSCSTPLAWEEHLLSFSIISLLLIIHYRIQTDQLSLIVSLWYLRHNLVNFLPNRANGRLNLKLENFFSVSRFKFGT